VKAAPRKPAAPLVLVCGEDDFAVQRRGRQLYADWCKEIGGMDHETIDATVSNSQEALRSLARLREALQTLPFFGSGKVIWLRQCNFLGDERVAGAQAVTASLNDLAQELKVRPGQGVAVQQVFDGSPAAKAGLEEGDIVLSFDNRPLHDAAELQEMVERTEPGSTHQLQVVRKGKPISVDVALEAMPEDFDRAAGGLPGMGEFQSPELGLAVMDLTPDMAESLGYQNQSGALVSRADRRGIAYRAGVRDGMLIVGVGKQSIKSVADFAAALANSSLEDGITLEIVTRQGRRTVTLQSS